MDSAILAWLSDELPYEDVAGKRVLEVGSGDVNGSVRPRVTARRPASYIGLDATPGRGVDVVGDALHLTDLYPPGSFDVVISTEMLEHVEDWPAVIVQMLLMLTPGGLLILTTRSPGSPYHGCPGDFWRFTLATFTDVATLAGLDILSLQPDPTPGWPGVFLMGRTTSSTDPTTLDLSGLRGVTAMERPEFLVLNHEGLLIEAPQW